MRGRLGLGWRWVGRGSFGRLMGKMASGGVGLGLEIIVARRSLWMIKEDKLNSIGRITRICGLASISFGVISKIYGISNQPIDPNSNIPHFSNIRNVLSNNYRIIPTK
jgi:hypothetical protein